MKKIKVPKVNISMDELQWGSLMQFQKEIRRNKRKINRTKVKGRR